jgi:hypothetical protein
MLFLFASVHNLISFSNMTEVIALYGAAFGTGASLSVVLCLIDANNKEKE